MIPLYRIHLKSPFDPYWFNRHRLGEHLGQITPDHEVDVDGTCLTFAGSNLPPGTAVTVWFETPWFVCVESDALIKHRQEQEQQTTLAREEHARLENADRARRRIEAQAFNARFLIPAAWDVAYIQVLSGLSERSLGNGTNRATVNHILLLDPLAEKHLRRKPGDLLCTPGHRNCFTDDCLARELDQDSQPYAPRVTCARCLKIAARWLPNEQ